jgi:hypothetical protein
MTPSKKIARPTGKIWCDLGLPIGKNILIFRNANRRYKPRRLVPLEGRIAIVTDAGRDAVDAAASGAIDVAGRLWP